MNYNKEMIILACLILFVLIFSICIIYYSISALIKTVSYLIRRKCGMNICFYCKFRRQCQIDKIIDKDLVHYGDTDSNQY